MTLPTENQDHSDQQIFQPAPTQSDMIALANQAKEAKRGRAQYFVFSIFLAGIVVAAVVGLSMMYTHMTGQVAAAESQRDAQMKMVQQKDAAIAQRDNTIAEQKLVIDSFGDFQSIKVLQDQNANLEKQITDLLGEPVRENAPARLKKMPEDVEWLDGAVTKLRERREALQALKADVESWPPPVQNPRPD